MTLCKRCEERVSFGAFSEGDIVGLQKAEDVIDDVWWKLHRVLVSIAGARVE
jgi:hypothetical protein